MAVRVVEGILWRSLQSGGAPMEALSLQFGGAPMKALLSAAWENLRQPMETLSSVAWEALCPRAKGLYKYIIYNI